MTSLINLKKAEHRNNELFVVLYSLLLEPIRISQISQKKKEGNQKLVR